MGIMTAAYRPTMKEGTTPNYVRSLTRDVSLSSRFFALFILEFNLRRKKELGNSRTLFIWIDKINVKYEIWKILLQTATVMR